MVTKRWTNSLLKNHNTSQELPVILLIGTEKVLSLESRIKDNVDHAGLSHPLVQLKVLNTLEPDNLPPFLSKTLWTAPQAMAIIVAEVVSCQVHSDMPQEIHSWLNKIIHTKVEMDNANTKETKVLLRYKATDQSQEIVPINWNQLSKEDQSQLLFKPIKMSSDTMTVVSSEVHHVEHNLTTVSSL